MIDLKLDTSHDLAVENLDLVLVDGEDFIVQRLDTQLQFFRGEWFLDVAAGVPYHQDFFQKNPNLAVIRAALREEILSVPGVNEVVKLETRLKNATRELIVNFTVDTTEGQVSMEAAL